MTRVATHSIVNTTSTTLREKVRSVSKRVMDYSVTDTQSEHTLFTIKSRGHKHTVHPNYGEQKTHILVTFPKVGLKLGSMKRISHHACVKH